MLDLQVVYFLILLAAQISSKYFGLYLVTCRASEIINRKLRDKTPRLHTHTHIGISEV